MKNLVSNEIGKISISISKIFWLYIILVPIMFIDFETLNIKTTIITLFLTFLTVCLGHSVGLHRGIIHKTYTTTKWFKTHF